MAGQALVAGFLCAGIWLPACAQIYTCVDAQGRRLTADRPITQCLDREQRELSATGTVKRRIGPVLTAQERAAEDEKARRELEERNRVAEEKKRDRALLIRYPKKAAHDQERASALAVTDEAIAAARKNLAQLEADRKRLDTQLEFYKGDPAKVPARLGREIEENRAHAQAQQRFIANQEAEKQRINARFDEELGKLQQLWALRAPAKAAGVASDTGTRAISRPASSSASR